MGTARARFWYGEVLPFAAMVLVECTTVGLNTLYKAATVKGLDYHVFILYSYGISALVLLPLCYIFHRKTPLPPFTIGLLCKFFCLGFLGFPAQYLGYLGINYSTPTLASAMTNLTPATTFVLAVLFRMEKLEVKSLSSQVKILGTVLTIGGALVVVLYKGPVLITTHLSSSASLSALITVSAPSEWVKGGALLAAEYIVVSFWYICQAKAVADYPAEMIVVFFFNLSCFIIAAPVCFIGAPNLSDWNLLKPDVRLFSVLYAGLLGPGFSITVHTWGLHVKGPVYVAMFKPLSIALAAVLGFIFLGDNLYLGSVIGSLIISLGFYTVIWGKAHEDKGDKLPLADTATESSIENVPLLKGYEERAPGATAGQNR
ncbi:hypothetical protein ACH5RR_011097 [Cinchona calisaya]|uniref:WAT1-related protein n=1 Tax=Cinchona calisaya TaxID=153742 RepID=A0ABD3A3Y6_9GENT